MKRILFSNGSIIDGSGRNRFTGDVLVSGDCIEEIGRIPPPAGAEVLDCSGLAIAPGFIDAHSHSDLQVLAGRPEKLLQGVTTELVGNCGFSTFPARADPAPLRSFANGILCGNGEWGWATARAYLDEARRSPTATVGALVGHGSLRIAVAGHAMGPLPEHSLKAMERLLEQCLDEGAAGLSTGLMYAPGSSAPFEELERLCRVVARRRKIYTSHIRSYFSGLVDAIDEQLNLARATGCTVQISHLQAAGAQNWHLLPVALERIEQARKEGVDAGFDCYPYVAGSTVLTQVLPQWVLEGGVAGMLARFRHPKSRRRIAEETVAGLAWKWSDIYISAVASERNRGAVGKNLAELARCRSVEPVDVMLDLLLAERGAVNMLSYNQSEENLRAALTHPLANVISDGFYVKGLPHPRLHGTFPCLLGTMCRERGWLTLEEAVHKITGAPARRFGFEKRGLLSPGYAADVTVFDPATVGSPATYEEPERPPEGIRRVLRNGCTLWALVLLCVFLMGTPARAQITGGMLSPSIDTPGRPFSYFWHPTDVIGALYAPVASEVTPEGYIYTGFGELMFFLGNPPEPVNQRIKTLYENYLPCVEYTVRKDGVRYDFQMFAADLGGELSGVPVNFIRVLARNESSRVRAAVISSGFRFSNHFDTLGRPQYRFAQRFPWLPARYTEGQTKYSPDWKYSFGEHALLRDGRMLYLYPADPQPAQLSLALADHGLRTWRYLSGQVAGDAQPKLQHDPYSVMGVVNYRLPLKPGEQRTLTFKMPLAPLPVDSPEERSVRAADYDATFQKTMSAWKELVPRAAPLQFPEAKVQSTLLANTIFNLLAIDKVGEDYIQSVNKFQYHRFYPTDAALLFAAIEDMGLQDIAAKVNLYNLKAQGKDGSPLVQPGLYEAFGHVMWGWYRHYALTGDTEFLRKVYPAVVRAVDWERKITAGDPMGLMPVCSIPDDAQLSGCHQTGQDLWTLAGLRYAIRMAEALGKSEDAAQFEAEYQRFSAAFDMQLASQTAKSGGYIPPSLECGLEGNDWDNLHILYPEPLFEPFDQRVTATLRHSRATYQEGILPYVWPRAIATRGGGTIYDSRPQLHYWHSTDNAQSALVRGSAEDQRHAVEDLYALLLHTSSTHATQEFGAVPWSTRDYTLMQNIMPDGSTSAVIVELLRNMLVREYGDELHLFSALSPDWLREGKTVAAVNEPTMFGPVTARLRTLKDGLEIDLSNRFRKAPKRVIVHLPWFYDVRGAAVDGRAVPVKDRRVLLPSAAGKLKIAGAVKPGTLAMSYERAVENYKREYRKRYDAFLSTGGPRP